MRRFPLHLIALVGAVVALAAGCGGGGSSSSAASLESSDVAVVGPMHITKDQLDHQITLRVKAAQADKQPLPKVGTSNYKSQVVDPIVQRLVTNAEVENIAKELGITVSDADVQKSLQDAVKAQFGTDTAKYHAFLTKYGLTEQDVIDQSIRPHLLETKIVDKLKSQYQVTDKQIADYYASHKSTYSTPDTRKVHYVLAKDKADADAAHAALANGDDFSKVVKKYSLDASSNPSGALTADSTPGQLEQNFQKAVFGDLETGGISQPVEVDKSYAQSTLAGKCKPTCYFVIKADEDVTKGGQQTLAQVTPQIRSTLEQTQVTQKLQGRIQQLLNEQKKLTSYASGYKPPAPANPSSSSGSTSG